MVHFVGTGKRNKVFVCFVQLLLECAWSKVFQLLTKHHPERPTKKDKSNRVEFKAFIQGVWPHPQNQSREKTYLTGKIHMFPLVINSFHF